MSRQPPNGYENTVTGRPIQASSLRRETAMSSSCSRGESRDRQVWVSVCAPMVAHGLAGLHARMQRVVGGDALVVRGGGRREARLAQRQVDPGRMSVADAQQPLELVPTELAVGADRAGADEEGRRYALLLEDGQRLEAVVGIAVVEGDHHRAAAVVRGRCLEAVDPVVALEPAQLRPEVLRADRELLRIGLQRRDAVVDQDQRRPVQRVGHLAQAPSDDALGMPGDQVGGHVALECVTLAHDRARDLSRIRSGSSRLPPDHVYDLPARSAEWVGPMRVSEAAPGQCGRSARRGTRCSVHERRDGAVAPRGQARLVRRSRSVLCRPDISASPTTRIEWPSRTVRRPSADSRSQRVASACSWR